MKKIIFLSMALLCFEFNVKSQSSLITFPVEGSVFQVSAGSNGTYALSFGGQARVTGGLRWQLDQKSGNTWVNILSNKVLISSTTYYTGNSTIGSTRSLFYFPGTISTNPLTLENSVNLIKGWYRLRLTQALPFFNNSKNFTLHQVEFGVGDVYFVAGQSNASGYGGAGYALQGVASNIRDNTNSSILTNTNSNNWARTFDSKQDEHGGDTYDVNPTQQILSYSIPYKVSFKPFINGLTANPTLLRAPMGSATGIVDRIGMYPNGYNSWYWAPLAHKLANENNTPTLWFNCASPSTSLQDVTPILNSWTRNIPDKNSLLGKLNQTIETFGGPFGAKAVLWHQGENDHKALMDGTTGLSPNNYQIKLNTIIDATRQAATGSPTSNALSWYVSKVSYYPYRNSINNSTNSTFSILSGVTSDYLESQNDKAWVSQNLKNNQTSTKSNVFNGPDTDLIDNSTTGKLRSSKYLIHLSGNSLQTAADEWYKSLTTSNSQPSLTLSPTTPIKITSVVRNGSQYTVTVDRPSVTDGSRVFYWCVEQYGLNTRATENGTNNFTFVGPTVGPDMFLHCYIKENGRVHAVVPFFIPGGTIEAKRLVLSNDNIVIPPGGGSTSISVTASESDWSLISIPSWVNYTFNENTNEIIFTASANSGALRTGQAVISYPNNELSKTINFEQAGSTVTTYTNLNTLTPNSNSGWYRLNTSIDNNTMRVGGNVTVNNGVASYSLGQPYYNGFGVHANNSLFFNLNGNYTSISGSVGRDDEGDNQWGSGHVVFYIKGDGVVKWTSAPNGSNTGLENFTNVNVAGVTTLELYCDISFDNNYFDHGDWINPILTSGSGGGGCTTSPAAPTGVAPSAYTVANTGQSVVLNASCAGGSTVTWGNPVNATGSPQTVVVNGVTTYSVTCVNSGCPPSSAVSFTVTVGPCSGLVSNNQVLGTWTATNHPLVVKSFHNTYWLTQRINASPEQFLVRGIGMLTRGDVTVTGSNYANNWSCFGWNDPAYGYLATPNSSQFPTPAGYTLAYECPNPNNLVPPPPCNATNGTPYYTFTGGARKAVEDTLVEEPSFVTIIPNPNKGDFTLKVDLEIDSPLDISIISSNGVVYENILFDGKKGMNYVPYKTKKVGSGRYILKVTTKDKVQSSVLVIE